MSDMQAMQQVLTTDMTSIGVPAKITESYPSFWGYQIGVLVPLQRSDDFEFLTGGFLDYTSTGGRVHYQDYSGEYRADQVADAYSPGILGDFREHLSANFDIDYQLSARMIYSKLSSTVLLHAGNALIEQNLDFHATSGAIEPAITPTYIFGRLRAGVSLSYMAEFTSSLESDEIPDAFLVDRNGKKLSLDWSGVRFGLVMGFTF
jgi:hypothetical protein